MQGLPMADSWHDNNGNSNAAQGRCVAHCAPWATAEWLSLWLGAGSNGGYRPFEHLPVEVARKRAIALVV